MWFCSVFFFQQKTAYEMRISDWSSDVCSSDLSVSAKKSSSPARSRSRRFCLGAAVSFTGLSGAKSFWPRIDTDDTDRKAERRNAPRRPLLLHLLLYPFPSVQICRSKIKVSKRPFTGRSPLSLLLLFCLLPNRAQPVRPMS